MNIVELIDKNAISTNLKAQGKEEVIAEMTDLLVSSGRIKKSEKDDIVAKLKERELLGSTGIGKGVAIPHAKCSKVRNMIAAFGVSEKGINYKSLDGEPTYIFFLLVAPIEAPGPHLKALAKISRLLDDKFVRDRLRLARSVQDVKAIIKEEEQKKAL